MRCSLSLSLSLALAAASVTTGGCSEQPPPPPRPAELVSLVLQSDPPGAAVLLDGRDRLGNTPLSLRRPAGSTLRLHFALEGYQPAVRNIFLEAASQQRVQVRLKRESGALIVDTSPIRGAKVIVDGSYRGRSPLRVEATLGVHSIRVEKDGADPFETTARIERVGQQLRIPVRLAPKQAPSGTKPAPRGKAPRARSTSR